MVFKCKMCDATLNFNPGDSVAECEYCGMKQTLPKYDDEREGNLYNRAEHYCKNNEFDKAQALYEEIVSEHPEDADAYWSVVLCKYGVEYVEEAGKINEIQKGILEISKKEEPFDIFICYKETDENGRRTLDSVLAADLYEVLKKRVIRCFMPV